MILLRSTGTLSRYIDALLEHVERNEAKVETKQSDLPASCDDCVLILKPFKSAVAISSFGVHWDSRNLDLAEMRRVKREFRMIRSRE